MIASYARLPVEFVRGEGSRLWDAEGNEYLDFLCGISVTSLGHCHPRVVAAVREQVGALMHTSNLFYTEPAMRLAAAPVAVEPRRQGVLLQLRRGGQRGGDQARAQGAPAAATSWCVLGAFHGRTYGSLSATPQESKQAPFAPLVPGFRAVEPTPEAIAAAVDAQTAAVISSRSRARAACTCSPRSACSAARAACDEHGAALIFDEIQCGMGRTGTLWAYEQTGVRPDALTTAKALGGGLPIGALVTGERLADVLSPGDHGSTFAGGPVVAAAALAALELTEDAALLENVRERGRQLADGPAAPAARGRRARARADARVRARRRRAGGDARALLSSSGW